MVLIRPTTGLVAQRELRNVLYCRLEIFLSVTKPSLFSVANSRTHIKSYLFIVFITCNLLLSPL